MTWDTKSNKNRLIMISKLSENRLRLPRAASLPFHLPFHLPFQLPFLSLFSASRCSTNGIVYEEIAIDNKPRENTCHDRLASYGYATRCSFKLLCPFELLVETRLLLKSG